MKSIIKKIVPAFVFSLYHLFIATAGAIYYQFPTRKMVVIGITGTKGKTSTTEILNAILEEANFNTAIASTLRFKIGPDSRPNMLKMTMPGHSFLHKFLAEAKNKKVTHAIVEMTSEGTKQWRHKFINLNGLIVTNLSPEHIESHGSYEKYRQAKLKIVKSLAGSSKKNKILVLNGDDLESQVFNLPQIKNIVKVNIKEAEPHTLTVDGLFFTYKNTKIQAHLAGTFNLYNILLAIKVAEHLEIDLQIIKKALENFGGIPGRVEKIFPQDETLTKLQNFSVIVDYAHTADSLEKVYGIYRDHKKICILGSTGGGRDKWKREHMGQIADKYCSHIILTDEDPYDEDPEQIINMVAGGIKNTPKEIILDRRLAIRQALELTEAGSVVFITGKGTDPYIMRSKGSKEPWSDANVAQEELTNLLQKRVRN